MKEYKALTAEPALAPSQRPSDERARVHRFFLFFHSPSSAREFDAKDIHMLDLRWLGQQIGCICHQCGSDRAG